MAEGLFSRLRRLAARPDERAEKRGPAGQPPHQGSGWYAPPQPTLNITVHMPEVVEALGVLASEIRTQFNAINRRLDTMSGTQNQLDADIQTLQQQVASDTDAENSAITLINGIPGLIQTAVNDALANGATQQQLQSLSDLSTTLQNNAQALASAVAANTPAAGGGGATSIAGGARRP